MNTRAEGRSRESDVMAGWDEAHRFLGRLAASGLLPGEALEIRSLDCSASPAVAGPRRYLTSVEAAARTALELRSAWDVFVGVGYRGCPDADDMSVCPHQTRGSDHVTRLPAAWADLDIGGEDPFELGDLLARLRDAEVTPDMIVASGRGLHCYWLFRTATAQLDEVVEVNRQIRDFFGADNAVDAARILRVPGTFNRKYGDPLPVRLIHQSDD